LDNDKSYNLTIMKTTASFEQKTRASMIR